MASHADTVCLVPLCMACNMLLYRALMLSENGDEMMALKLEDLEIIM